MFFYTSHITKIAFYDLASKNIIALSKIIYDLLIYNHCILLLKMSHPSSTDPSLCLSERNAKKITLRKLLANPLVEHSYVLDLFITLWYISRITYHVYAPDNNLKKNLFSTSIQLSHEHRS